MSRPAQAEAAPAPELPPVFLAYQQELMNSVEIHAVTVVEKSRRTGYSWAAAAIAALTAGLQAGAGGQDVLYMGYEKEMTREFIGYVAEWARSYQLAADVMEEFVWRDPAKPEADIGAFRIKFASGFEVVALPSVPRALRGKQGLVILDEAAFMDELEEVLKAALALLIWGGKVLVISTHNGENNPFNTLVTDIRAGRVPYHLLRCTLDEALADGLYRRVCLKSGTTWSAEAETAWRDDLVRRYGAGADEELFVIPSPTSGTFLPAPLIEARMDAATPVLRWQPPAADFAQWADHLRHAELADWIAEHLAPLLHGLDAETPHALGMDFGRRVDLSVIWPLGIGRDLVRHTPFVLELRNMPFRQQEQLLFHLLDRLPRFRAAALDAGGNGMALAEFAGQRYGTRVQQVMLSEPWYREHMPALKAAFEDATITAPKDRDILTDFRMLRLVRGVARVPERSTGSDGGQRHGDAAIAAALAIFASKAEPEAYGYQAVRSARAGAEAAFTGFNPEESYEMRRPMRGLGL